MIRLTAKNVIALHKQMIEKTGGSYGVRDEGLLESALASPFMTYDQIELFPSVYQKAARLCFGFVKNHPFIDGNKRIGTQLMLILLTINEQIVKTAQGASKKRKLFGRKSQFIAFFTTQRLQRNRGFCAFFRICSFIAP